MNTINYVNVNKKFPVSTQSLDFMQKIIQQAHQLALLGGSVNYILTGCTNVNGNNWASGTVVINGELLPFVGGVGTTTSSVRIKESKTNIVAGYDTYNDAYVTRWVEFGSNIGNVDTYFWNTFTRVKSNLQLAAESATKEELTALSNLMMPKGGIIMWSGTIAAIPVGYALCDGATVQGVTTPDLRGRFVVGYKSDSLNLPANVTDTTENYGAIKNTGGKPSVALVIAETPAHSHANGIPTDLDTVSIFGTTTEGVPGASSKVMAVASPGGTRKSGLTSSAGGGAAHENRPPYYVLAFIIKVV